MKNSARVNQSSKSKVTKTTKSVVKRTRASSVSKSVKNYGKKSLRAVLLSHTFHTGFRAIIISILVLAPFYGVYAYIGKTVANEIVISKSQILERVATHTILPVGNPEAVVRVQDAESLKRQNSFYDQVKSGDYIIMYKSLAIIYDLRSDQILAIKNITETVPIR